MVTGLKQMKQEQVWHQIKNTTVGSEFVEQMCFPLPNLLLRIQPLLRSLAEQMHFMLRPLSFEFLWTSWASLGDPSCACCGCRQMGLGCPESFFGNLQRSVFVLFGTKTWPGNAGFDIVPCHWSIQRTMRAASWRIKLNCLCPGPIPLPNFQWRIACSHDTFLIWCEQHRTTS